MGVWEGDSAGHVQENLSVTESMDEVQACDTSRRRSVLGKDPFPQRHANTNIQY